MKDGDLVELIQDPVASRRISYTGEISVGNMVDGSRPWQSPAGTLAVYLGRHPRMPGEPAIVILIDGKLGWVWQNEIRPANITHNGGDHERW